MTTTVDFDIVGSFNVQRYPSINSERSINLFEYIDKDSKKAKTSVPTSGIVDTGIDFSQVDPGAEGGFRAQFVFQDTMYQIIGNNIFSIKNISTFPIIRRLNIVNLDTNSGYANIDANTFQVIFVDGSRGYIFDTTTNLFTPITDPAFPSNPIDVCYLDGFFIVAHGGTNQFQMSQLNNGLIWGNDNSGTLNTIQFSNGSSNITVTPGTVANYQVGTPVTISGSTDAVIVDGNYFIAGTSGLHTIKVSKTNGGIAKIAASNTTAFITNNGQLQQGQINSHPGTIAACRTLHRKVFFFSQNFTEVWENQGAGTNLPIRRNNNALMEVGTPAIGSVAVGFDRLLFLSQDRDGLGPVMMVTGQQAVPVTNRALDYQFAQYAQGPGVSDARGIMIKENGILFYRLNFTAADDTYVFNITMSDDTNVRWHEEQTLRGNRHVAQTHGYFFGNNYYGDYQSPILYLVNSNLQTNNGESIKRTLISKPFVPPGYQRIRIDRFQLDLLQGSVYELNTSERGIGLLTEDNFFLLTENDEVILEEQSAVAQGITVPEVFFSYSKDGGQSYGDRIIGPMGAIGDRAFRTLWRKLGVVPRGQAFVCKIEFYNTVPFVVLGAAWAYDILPE